jgi:hypothetical protein
LAQYDTEARLVVMQGEDEALMMFAVMNSTVPLEYVAYFLVVPAAT